MKDHYTYEAEYVSTVGEQHYFNVDLGFRAWYVTPLRIENEDEYKPKTGDKFFIEVHLTKVHRLRTYSCIILKKL